LRKKIIAAQLQRIQNLGNFPFEKTLLDALEDLKQTKPVYPKDVLLEARVARRWGAAARP
jgi:hypothetical protein